MLLPVVSAAPSLPATPPVAQLYTVLPTAPPQTLDLGGQSYVIIPHDDGTPSTTPKTIQPWYVVPAPAPPKLSGPGDLAKPAPAFKPKMYFIPRFNQPNAAPPAELGPAPGVLQRPVFTDADRARFKVIHPLLTSKDAPRLTPVEKPDFELAPAPDKPGPQR